jgi:hypothetical protein
MTRNREQRATGCDKTVVEPTAGGPAEPTAVTEPDRRRRVRQPGVPGTVPPAWIQRPMTSSASFGL